MTSQLIGYLLWLIPMQYWPILGKFYRKELRRIERFNKANEAERSNLIIDDLKSILNFAYERSPFYRNLYDKSGLVIDNIRSINDFKEFVPIVTKDDLKGSQVSTSHPGLESNTGGSSGTPLKFSISANQLGVEWANLHHFFKLWGVNIRTPRIMFVGQVRLRKNIEYDALKNCYFIDVYRDSAKILEDVSLLFQKSKSPFVFHGYPSIIKQVVAELIHNGSEILRSSIESRLEAILLCSEYVSQSERQFLKDNIACDIFTFYGHSERCIIANENLSEDFHYHVSHTYGYTEIKDNRLIGTSFHNYAFPFIRYDTGDTASVGSCSGVILESFVFDKGRAGDFVLDRGGAKIQLTALIFGRHHKVFELVDSLQVYQRAKGELTLFIVPSRGISQAQLDNPSLIDFSNVNLTYEICLLENPILTKVGKRPLLISEELLKLVLRTKTYEGI